MTNVLDGPRREIRRIFHEGTPGNRPCADVVEVEVTGVGKISNTVAECPAPHNLAGHMPTESEEVVRVTRGGDWWAERDAERVQAAVAAGGQ